jgi:membrane protein involved in colicin uptake
MSDYRAPKNDKNHPADDWVGEARAVAIIGKPVEDAIVILRAKAEGLDNARLRQDYHSSAYLSGFRPKTQIERDREAKKKADEEAADAKRRATEEAYREKRKAETAAQEARWKAESEAAKKREQQREEATAKRQARLIAAQLREMGYIPARNREA